MIIKVLMISVLKLSFCEFKNSDCDVNINLSVDVSQSLWYSRFAYFHRMQNK